MAVPGHDPRHRRQPRLRVHHPGPARRPATRHPARPRTRPLRALFAANARDTSPTSPRLRSPDRAGQREPIAVLADILSRDGAEQSASAIRQRNLANADHLATLHAIWTAETQAARHDRYRDLVTAALPPGHRQPLSHQARWLYRTLHAAELAGLDPAEVIRTAIASRDLAGSRDIAAVLDARIRPRIDPLLPQPQGPWTRRVPRLPDPDRHAYLAQIAAMMDDRTRRLGQHTAQTTPAWAIQALGPVPADPAARQDWEHKAASIAAYREMYGYDHPDDPIGPEPSHQAPDQRAAWHQAFAALGPASQPDVRAMPDGRLWLARDSYAAQTAWAPRHVGKELRLSRLGAFDAALGAIRADAEDSRRPQGRRLRPRRPARAPGRQLPGPARPLPAARTGPRPGHGRPAGMGAGHRPDPGAWPSPPTPNSAAATPAGRSSPCALPNQPLSATPDASTCTSPGRANSPREQPGSATWPCSVKHSAPRWTSSPRLIVPGEDPARGDLGEAFPALCGRLARMRSCSRPNRRSPPRRGSSSSPPSTTSNPTAKPRTDQTDAMRRNHQRATRKRRNRHSYKSAITAISSQYVTSSELQLARTIT